VEIWSVYHQSVEPRCAVRKLLIGQDGLFCTSEEIYGTLIEARSILARRGLVKVPRAPGDEPSLIETWL
jgi:hypothetical protein